MTLGYCEEKQFSWQNVWDIEDRQPPLVATNPLLFYIKGVSGDSAWQKEFLASLESAKPYCLVCTDNYPIKLCDAHLGLPSVVYVVSDDEQSAYRFTDASDVAKENPSQVWLCCTADKTNLWQQLCVNSFQEKHSSSKFFDSLESLSQQIKLNVKHYLELYPGMEKPNTSNDI